MGLILAYSDSTRMLSLTPPSTNPSSCENSVFSAEISDPSCGGRREMSATWYSASASICAIAVRVHGRIPRNGLRMTPIAARRSTAG